MGDEYFKTSFRPLLPDVRILEFNDLKALQLISSKTAAVIIEPIQGEAGVRKANRDYIKNLRKICDDRGVILIFDEIQTGFGRTGNLFVFEEFDVVPDILLISKGMGGGLPIGAFIASTNLMSNLTKNPILGHINTFGGNALCVAAANACLEIIISENLCSRAKQIENIITTKLKHPLIKEIRIHGALGAIDFYNEVLNMRVIKSCIEKGIICDWFLFCPTAMRIAPPLIITDSELIEALNTIIEVLNTIEV